ncbi:MAG TPA: 3-methyl-2-oxobutanoate hydroxymethyltransferase [Solirubrobacterales bacterium]|nr:3-methyl-2-oxobutanoate hydroxymethyltransferase [Solirubrobacterales bacterium]
MSTEPRTPDAPPSGRRPVTIPQLAEMKRAGEPIVMMTAYDFPSAQVAEEAGVDLVLVGDTAAMTVLGYDSTVPVSMDEMVMLASAVRRGAHTPLVIGDLPFGSYQSSNEQAVRSAVRYLKEAGCDAVKLEMAGVSGAVADKAESVARARAIVSAGIPVMGHVGLTPQSASALGGYRTQGRTMQQAVQVADDALALQDAGCFAVVFEAVPGAVTEVIMDRMRIPVIGIGAGASTDGQVLVFHDLLGLYEGHTPRFVKRFAEVKREMVDGVRAYAEEVRERRFPAAEHTYSIDPEELERFQEVIAPGKPWDAADFMG